MDKNAPTIAKRKYKIFIVDDHPIVRKGLSQLINQANDMVVCGEAEGANATMEFLKHNKPDLVIIDISLRGIDGIELIKKIKDRYPDILTLVVSMHDETVFAERALRAGAKGYIMKQEAIEKILDAIRRVLRGEIYISEKVSEIIVKKFIDGKQESKRSPVEVLSDRELEVFNLIGQGYNRREIAELMHISVKTVESYRAKIKEKLNLKSGTELIKHAIYWVESR